MNLTYKLLSNVLMRRSRCKKYTVKYLSFFVAAIITVCTFSSPVTVFSSYQQSETLLSSNTINVPGENHLTITQAINQVQDGGIIQISPGNYNEHIEIIGISKRFTIKASSEGSVTISASGSKGIMVIRNSGPITIDGINFSNGFSSIDGYGGGVSIDNSIVTIVNCAFIGNKGEQPNAGGGGIFAVNGAKVFIDNTKFEGNTDRNYGGAIAIESGSLAYIIHSAFLSNFVNVKYHLSTSAGGAIHVGNSKLRVASSTFVNNEAGYVGGAIYAIGQWMSPYEQPRSDVVISNSLFRSNKARRDSSVTFSLPTEAGAVHGEDQTRIRIFNSRFVENFAEIGGAVNSYRSKIEVYDSVFLKNRALLFGGAISATSNDTTIDGSINRPNAHLIVERSFIQGFGWGVSHGESAGGIYISGDTNRQYGNNGVSKIGTSIDNRAYIMVRNVVFFDLDTQVDSSKSHAGALMVDLGDATITNNLFLHNRSVSGGAVSLIQDTKAYLLKNIFLHNFAQKYGGALYASGVEITISDSKFVANEIGTIGNNANESYGAALFISPMIERQLSVQGVVQSNVFSENIGLPIYDRDTNSTPINNVKYDNNQFFTSYFYGQVYTNSNAGYCCKTVDQLNTLTISRNGSSTKKCTQNNLALNSPAILAVIYSSPSTILPTGAIDEQGPIPIYIAYGWSGNIHDASVNGATAEGEYGVYQTMLSGEHYIIVNNEKQSIYVENASKPKADFQVFDGKVTWSLRSGKLLDLAVDQGVDIIPSTEGQVFVYNYNSQILHRLFIITEEGGIVISQPLLSTPQRKVTTLVGLNMPPSQRLGYIPITNKGGGELEYTAKTDSPELIEIINPTGTIEGNGMIKFLVKREELGIYSANITIDAKNAGQTDVEIIVQIVPVIRSIFLPLVVKH
ncbi:MAG: hypothetical protein QXL34_07030 [Thermosphaera sp.]